MSLYRATAIVVRTFKVAEADRIAVLVTLEHGKVRAVVKGVRKTTARHGLRLEPLAHVALQLYRGRELDTVTQVQGIDAFPAIRNDLDRLARAAIMLEAVEMSTMDREPDPRRYQLLLGALRALESQDRPLVVSAMLPSCWPWTGWRRCWMSAPAAAVPTSWWRWIPKPGGPAVEAAGRACCSAPAGSSWPG